MINVNFNLIKKEFFYIKKSNYPITIKLIYIVSLFVPVFAITGPFLPDLSVCIIGILFIIFCVNQKGKNLLEYKKYIIFFLFLYIILILSAINSSYIQQSVKVFFYIRFFIYFLAIVYLINELKNYKYIFFEFLKIIFYVLFLDSTFQYFFHFNILGISPLKIIDVSNGQEIVRSIILTSFFGNEKVLGSYLVRLFPLFIYLFFFVKKKTIFTDFAYISIFSSILILLTIFSNERIAVLYSFFIFLFLLFFVYFYKNKNYIFFFFLTILPLCAFIFNINNSNEKIYHTYQQIRPDNSFVFFSTTHSKYANSSIEIFKKNILFGSGPKTFLVSCENSGFSWEKDECNIHPHNIFFQILSEVGLLGIAIYFYLLFLFGKLFTRYFKEQNIKIFLLISIFMFINPIFPSGNLFNNWFNIVNWISIPFIFAKRND